MCQTVRHGGRSRTNGRAGSAVGHSRRRDPANPDKAIRIEADLGVDDGRWIVIKSGVAEGNEVVLEGVYQLMVATSGSISTASSFQITGNLSGSGSFTASAGTITMSDRGVAPFSLTGTIAR